MLCILQSYSDILSFAKKNYKVNFPIFSKIDVIGDNAPEAWAYLTGKNLQVYHHKHLPVSTAVSLNNK